MSDLPLCFEAVLFDLDGTLVATDGFWVDAARAGAKRAFAELGLARELPTASEWMGLVGLPLAQGFAALFHDLAPDAVQHVLQRCVEEETFALQAGRARLLPGAGEALSELAARGLKLGIASNCGKGYLTDMLRELDLARWVPEARCLDSAGVHDKADMLTDLLLTFDTRSAVMVGDRAGDREAAHENGLPHVHVARGFAPPGEDVAAEAAIDGLAELVPLLERRGAWLAGVARSLDLCEPAGRRPASLGVTGPPGAGKTLLAADLVRVLAARGVAARVLELEAFARRPATEPPVDRPREWVEAAYDLERLERCVLIPHAAGAAVELGPQQGRLAAHELLILEGTFLAHPRLTAALERVLALALDEGLALRRIGARDAHLAGPDSLLRVRRTLFPAWRALEELRSRAEAPDLVLAVGNPLGPGP